MPIHRELLIKARFDRSKGGYGEGKAPKLQRQHILRRSKIAPQLLLGRSSQ
jgi:hypothetical protein